MHRMAVALFDMADSITQEIAGMQVCMTDNLCHGLPLEQASELVEGH